MTVLIAMDDVRFCDAQGTEEASEHKEFLKWIKEVFWRKKCSRTP